MMIKSHPKHEFEGVLRSRNPTTMSCPSLKINKLCKNIMLTDCSTAEELNRSGTVLVNPTTAIPIAG